MEVAFDERQQTCEQRVADDTGFLQGRSVIHGLLDEFRDFGPETFRTPLFQGVLLVDESLQASLMRQMASRQAFRPNGTRSLRKAGFLILVRSFTHRYSSTMVTQRFAL